MGDGVVSAEQILGQIPSKETNAHSRAAGGKGFPALQRIEYVLTGITLRPDPGQPATRQISDRAGNDVVILEQAVNGKADFGHSDPRALADHSVWCFQDLRSEYP